jgi:hypothetical protein
LFFADEAHPPHHHSPICLIIYKNMATVQPSAANAGIIAFIEAARWLPTPLVTLPELPLVPKAWAT